MYTTDGRRLTSHKWGTVMIRYLQLGDVAARLGCREWQLRRLFERGLVPEPARAGRGRVFTEADLPALRSALVNAGYLPSDQADPRTVAADAGQATLET